MGLPDVGSLAPYGSTFLFSWYCVVVELCGGEVGCWVVLGRGDGGCQDGD